MHAVVTVLSMILWHVVTHGRPAGARNQTTRRRERDPREPVARGQTASRRRHLDRLLADQPQILVREAARRLWVSPPTAWEMAAGGPTPRVAEGIGRHYPGTVTECKGTYLRAWQDDQNVGRATLYAESKYHAVRQIYADLAEINALEADPQGLGTGTALIEAAEAIAALQGRARIGLAVEPSNENARRLYERLGYASWGRGHVVDEWIERRDNDVQVLHRDWGDYLVKSLAHQNFAEPPFLSLEGCLNPGGPSAGLGAITRHPGERRWYE